MTLWVNIYDKERCLSHSSPNAQYPAGPPSQGSVVYATWNSPSLGPEPWHVPFSLSRTLFSQMSTRLAHIIVYIRYWLKYPFLRQPLQPYCLQSLDHSHSHLIKLIPFLAFIFHCIYLFLAYHIFHLSCLVFFTFPQPAPISAGMQIPRRAVTRLSLFSAAVTQPQE